MPNSSRMMRRRVKVNKHRLRQRNAFIFGGSRKRPLPAFDVAPPVVDVAPPAQEDEAESLPVAPPVFVVAPPVAPPAAPPLLTKHKYTHDDYDEYIKEWMSIQNIVSTPNKFGRAYLTPLPAGTIDACNESKPCLNHCIFYQSQSDLRKPKTCVTRTRIKRFQAYTVARKLFGKNNQEYKIVDAKLLRNPWELYDSSADDDDGDEIFYYVYISERTSHIYVNFSTWKVLKKCVNTYPQINEYLNHLIDNIMSQTLAVGKKVVLCGHSFGCVLALYTGKLIFEKYRTFFDNHIVIVGSAPFKFLETFGDFKHLNNVKVFVLCTHETGNHVGHIDQYIHKGPIFAATYEPMIYLNEDGVDGVIPQNAIKNIIFNGMLDLHIWMAYYDALAYIFGIPIP